MGSLVAVRDAIFDALENATDLKQYIRDITDKDLQIVDYGTGLHIPGAMIAFNPGTILGGTGTTNGYFSVRFFLPFYREKAFRQCLTVGEMATEVLTRRRSTHIDPMTGQKYAVVILPFEISVVDEYVPVDQDGKSQSSFWVVELSPRTMSGEMS